MQFTTRSEWGARAPAKVKALPKHDEGWFWHWLGPAYPEQTSDIQIMQSIQRYHMDTKGWSDVAYHWAIGRDGGIFQGRGWAAQGGATYGYNTNSYALVFLIGQGEYPSIKMLAAAEEVMLAGPAAIRNKIRPHSAVRSTSCPGDQIRAYIKNRGISGTMTQEQAENAVEGLYAALLGRPSDDAGLKYWAGLLLNGTSLEDIRWEFVKVRFAAYQTEIDTLARQVDGAISSTSTAAVVKAASSKFYKDLADWAQGQV